MRIRIPEEYPYLYETHLHTRQSSACGRGTGSEMAAACKDFGYTGAFITDHNWGGNTCVSRELPWEEWISDYACAYLSAKAFGDKNDFDVFFGMETGFDGTEFLIFGLTPDWFIEHEEFRTADIPTQYKLVHEAGGMISQAHPYRVEPYIPEIRVFPEYTDAVEVFNAMHSSPLSTRHNDPSWNDTALKLALDNNNMMTAGSDIHSTQLIGGGMSFKRRLASSTDFCDMLKTGEYIMSDGAFWHDSKGARICPVIIE